jgi:phosphoglycolate phosphatase
MALISQAIKAVLFDHDDTLVGTIEAKWAEHKYVAKQFYGKDLTDDELRQHWGKPLPVMAGLLYGTEDLQGAMANIMTVHDNFPKKLHDDTLSVLQSFRTQGKKLGVVTATSRFSLLHDLKTLRVPKELFDYMQTEENTDRHKPDPLVFKPAVAWLQTVHIIPEEAVYVGDGLHDMQAALGAGFEFIGVSTGLVTQDDFHAEGVRSIKRLGDLVVG